MAQIECECGLFGQDTEANAKMFIRNKEIDKGERNWRLVTCPISGVFHCYNASLYHGGGDAEFINDIRKGTHRVRLDAFRKREASKEATDTPKLSACAKIKFPNQELANQALTLAVSKGREEKSAYPCLVPGCEGKWHLTSQPQIRKQEIKRFPHKENTWLSIEHVWEEALGKETYAGAAITMYGNNEKNYARVMLDNDKLGELMSAILEASSGEP